MVVVPVALWNGAPSHHITAVVAASPNVFTGSSSGEICLWSVDEEERRLVPTILMVGNECAVVALAVGTSKHNLCVVSLARNAALKVWAASDGRFLGECYEMPQLLAHALAMVALGDGRSVAVSGASRDIFVADLSTRTVTGVIRGSSDWVACLQAPGPSHDRAAPMLVSATQDGTVTVWSHPPPMPHAAVAAPMSTSSSSSSSSSPALVASAMALAAGAEAALPVHPIATLALPAMSPDEGPVLEACVSPDSSFVAVVTRTRWALMSRHTGKLLLTVVPPMISFLKQEVVAPESEQLWGGGSFLEPRKFIAWTEAGVGCVYSLEHEDGAYVVHLTHCTEPPHLAAFHSLSANSPPAGAGERKLSISGGSPLLAMQAPPQSSRTAVVASLRGSLFASAMGSSVGLWRIELGRPSCASDDGDASDGSLPLGAAGASTSSPIVCASEPKLEALVPAARGCFTSAWATLDDRSSVTCCCVLEDILTMVCGHQNGEISSSVLPTDPFPRRVQAHAKRVTAVMAPHPSISAAVRFLVSAGDDFSIKVWDLFTFELKHSFSMHSGPILRLIPVAPQSATLGDSALKHSFLSIGADRCVGIFSLDTFQSQHWLSGHPAPITAIRWKAERDMMLVSCADTSLCVWELSSGRLITQLSGLKAKEAVTNYCLPVYIARRGFDASQAAEDLGITSAMITVGEAPNSAPVQVLHLNVRQLSAQLEKAQQQPSTIQRRFSFQPKGKPAAPPLATHRVSPSTPDVPLSTPGTDARAPAGAATTASQVTSFRFPPFAVLAYLIPWGLDETTDGFCRRELFLRPPSPFGTLGLAGENGNMALVLPAVGSQSGAAFKHSHHLSGTIALSAVTLSKTLLGRKDNTNIFSHLMTFYSVILPEIFPGFVEPSLPFLSNFWNDALPDIQQSARSIFNAILDRMSPAALREFSATFRKFLLSKGEGEHTLAFRVLGIVGSEKPEALDKELAKMVTNELYKVIMAEANPLTSCSVDIFARGFSVWKPHLEDQKRAVLRLFNLVLDKAKHATASRAASHALVSIAIQDTRTVITMLDNEISGHRNQAAAIGFLEKITRRWSKDLVTHLPMIIETFIHALDPASPAIREKCLRPTTALIQGLCANFPMVCFNTEVQRLAVGTANAIIVFDLKTASPWVTFQTGVSSLATAFSTSGKGLAAYCSDARVYVWYLSGLFSHFKSLFVMSTVDVTVPVSGGTRQYSEAVRIHWASPSQLVLENARTNASAPVTINLEKSA